MLAIDGVVGAVRQAVPQPSRRCTSSARQLLLCCACRGRMLGMPNAIDAETSIANDRIGQVVHSQAHPVSHSPATMAPCPPNTSHPGASLGRAGTAGTLAECCTLAPPLEPVRFRQLANADSRLSGCLPASRQPSPAGFHSGADDEPGAPAISDSVPPQEQIARPLVLHRRQR